MAALAKQDPDAPVFVSLPGDSVTFGHNPIVVTGIQPLSVLRFGPLDGVGNIKPCFHSAAVNVLLEKRWDLLSTPTSIGIGAVTPVDKPSVGE
jgi:hypothetical protein